MKISIEIVPFQQPRVKIPEECDVKQSSIGLPESDKKI